MYIIYALIDSRNYRTRYVGITRTGYVRFQQHLAMLDKNHRKNGWIQEIEDAGEMVIMEVIDKADSEESARQKEAYWIQFFSRNPSNKLLNRTHPDSIRECTASTPGVIEFFLPTKALPWIADKFYQSQDFLNLRINVYDQYTSLYYDSQSVTPTISSCYIHAHDDFSYWYFSCRWIKREFEDLLVLCYRTKLHQMDWAVFGDSEVIKKCAACEVEFVPLKDYLDH